VILLGLLIATAAAFAVTERLKLVPSPITGPHISKVFSPACGCARRSANISLKLRHGDRVDVLVLGEHRARVRTIAAGLRVPRGRSVFRWDGTTDSGGRAEDGTYRVQIHLRGQHRTILLPNRIALDTAPPKVDEVSTPRPRFSPDGDHRADDTTIRYSLSEPAHALVYLDGRRIIRSRFAHQQDDVKWYGALEGRALPPGTYTLSMGAVDAAGNVTPSAQRAATRVEIRYIALAERRLVARRSRRLAVRVSTDAVRYAWRLGARHGVAAGHTLRLRAPKTRGRYTLTVAERGHVARAVVVVR
jgi:hypothetical protein